LKLWRSLEKNEGLSALTFFFSTFSYEGQPQIRRVGSDTHLSGGGLLGHSGGGRGSLLGGLGSLSGLSGRRLDSGGSRGSLSDRGSGRGLSETSVTVIDARLHAARTSGAASTTAGAATSGLASATSTGATGAAGASAATTTGCSGMTSYGECG
jgi:hypothetical protein